jgi:hypothetical protein
MMAVTRAWPAVAVIAVVLPGMFGQPEPDQPVKPVTVCEVLGDLPKFSGKGLAILGRLDCQSSLIDRTCFLAQDHCERPITTEAFVWPTNIWIAEYWDEGIPKPPSANPLIDEPTLIDKLSLLRKTTKLRSHRKDVFKTLNGWGVAYGKVYSSPQLESKPSCVDKGCRGFRGAPVALIINRDSLRSFKNNAYPSKPQRK